MKRDVDVLGYFLVICYYCIIIILIILVITFDENLNIISLKEKC